MSNGSVAETIWRVASRCEGGHCVEVAVLGESVLVRSSADPAGNPITFSRDEWREFAAEVKSGIFDLL